MFRRFVFGKIRVFFASRIHSSVTAFLCDFRLPDAVYEHNANEMIPSRLIIVKLRFAYFHRAEYQMENNTIVTVDSSEPSRAEHAALSEWESKNENTNNSNTFSFKNTERGSMRMAPDTHKNKKKKNEYENIHAITVVVAGNHIQSTPPAYRSTFYDFIV